MEDEGMRGSVCACVTADINVVSRALAPHPDTQHMMSWDENRLTKHVSDMKLSVCRNTQIQT